MKTATRWGVWGVWGMGLAIVMAMAMTPSAMAQQRGESLEDLIGEFRDRLVDRYDKDGDGDLSREEQEEGWRKAREEMRQSWESRWDEDGDGKLSDAERAKMEGEIDARREEWRQRMEERRAEWQRRRELREWDKDGDGILSDAEKAAMEAAKKAEAEKAAALKAAVMAAYDTDQDGELSNAELTAMLQKIEQALEHIAIVEQVAQSEAAAGNETFAPVSATIRKYRSSRGDLSRLAQEFGRRARGGGDADP